MQTPPTASPEGFISIGRGPVRTRLTEAQATPDIMYWDYALRRWNFNARCICLSCGDYFAVRENSPLSVDLGLDPEGTPAPYYDF